MKKPQPKKPRRRRTRRFQEVDLHSIAEDYDYENPDWLVGAN